MNEAQMQSLLEVWYRGREVPPRDVSEGVAIVMANVPRTRQQGRWWPLPALERPVSTFPGRGLAPAPTPATNGRRRPREFTMFSALKFIAAGVIVALFGGFLLAGVLTTQRDGEVFPAAATESPKPGATSEPTEAPMTSVRTDLLPGFALTVEEVEPGVHRVVDDGVHDLTAVAAMEVAAGYDGGIRLLRGSDFLRLGSDETHQWPDVPRGDDAFAFEVAPDGTMWVIPCGSGLDYPRPGSDYPRQCGDARRSTDGEAWTAVPCPEGSLDCQGFTVASDGTVWATWRVSGSTSRGQWAVGHLGPAGWQPLDGYARYYGTPFRGYQRMWVTDAGDVYGVGYDDVYRYEDGDWDNVAPRRWFTLADVGPDGTIWLGNNDGLARFADGEWEAWRSDDILGTSHGFGKYGGDIHDDYLGEMGFEVAPDGSLWFSPWRMGDRTEPLVCDGLVRFDGRTLDRFLPGRCISMDIAAEGSVWVLANDETVWVLDEEEWVLADDQAWDLYVISPEAVPTPEVIDIRAVTTTTSDILPGVMLTVEEVDAGVLRVVSDGVRNVEQVTMTAVGDDGTVWIDSAEGILELGRAGEHPSLIDGEGFLAVARDGTLWAASGAGPDDLRSFDGETWNRRITILDGMASVPDPWWSPEEVRDLAVHPDGSVWQVGAKLLGYGDAYPRLRHLDTDTSTIYGIGEGLPDPGWCEEEPCPLGRWGCDCDDGWHVEITPDGMVWVGIPGGGLLRLDGTDWEVVRPLGGDEDHGVIGLASNRDGILWAEFMTGYLARFDGRAWEAFSYAPALDLDPPRALSVDPDGNLWVGDGNLWVGANVRCDGVRRFDGSTWTTFLPGLCAADIDITGDGSAWVTVPRGVNLSWVPGYGVGGDLYVITPEAVAASE